MMASTHCRLQIADCRLFIDDLNQQIGNSQSAICNLQSSIFWVHPITSSPIERAVPATVLIAASSDSQLRSGIFVFAISSTCLAVTVPTFVLFGSAEPLAMLAARLSSTAAGGVFVMKV